MADPITTTLTLAFLKPILNSVATSASLYFTDEFKKRFKLDKFSVNNIQLVESVEKIGLVKTLFTGAEKPVELSTFFYLPYITTEHGISRIHSIDEISTSHSILIEATVGQGKSILMRYLALQEVAKNSRIPIFIELKNISKDKNLNTLIKEKIKVWTNIITDDQIDFILQSGRVSLFLDAFDEISKDFLIDTLTSIEHLANNYSNLKLIVSSRPEREIKFSHYFEVIQVNPYDDQDQKNLINILVQDKDAQITLINSIENSTPEIKNLLTTPLMIGLYVRKFNADFSPPENITSFYKNIFEVVATTHDRTKGGYSRLSSSGFQQDKLEKIFERFCFECYKKDKTSFERSEIISILEITLRKLNLDVLPSKILDDFCKYLCLILKDGLNYTFIHRSIFEYYVAFFLSKLNSENAEKVIPKIQNTNIIQFLKVLNIYYFNKYYFNDELLYFFKLFNNSKFTFGNKEQISKKFLNFFKIGFVLKDNTFQNDPELIFIRKTLLELNKSPYLYTFYIAPIVRHIFDKYEYIVNLADDNEIESGKFKINQTKTDLFHSRLDNDEKVRELYKKIFIAYNDTVLQIQAKENEITIDDFNDF